MNNNGLNIAFPNIGLKREMRESIMNVFTSQEQKKTLWKIVINLF